MLFPRLRLVTCKGTLSVITRQNSLWTAGNVVKSPAKDILVPDVPLHEYVWKNLDKWPTKTAIVCGVTDRSYTYEQVYYHSRNFAAHLRKSFNIQDGDCIAVMLPNLPEYPAVLFGIMAAGGLATTINPGYTAHEVQRQLTLSEAKLVITTPEIAPVMKEALKIIQKDLPMITVTGSKINEAASFEELMNSKDVDKDVLKEVRRVAGDVCLLPCSSGTTGLPKGVELTHRNIVANCEQQNTELRHYEFTTGSHQDSVVIVLPMFHMFALSVAMVHKFSAGLRLVSLPSFQPRSFLDAMVQYRVSLMYTAPPLALFLGSHPAVSSEHFAHLNTIVCGAAPLPGADVDNVLRKAGKELDFLQGYGLTETSPLATVSPPGSRDRASAGVPIPSVELRVVDAELRNLGPNEVGHLDRKLGSLDLGDMHNGSTRESQVQEGELLIRGPNIMKGYKDNPEANEEAFAEAGWLRSGDLARVSDAGALYICDRLKELIKVKGFQVPPAELEAALKEHPGVLDAAVVGAPDDEAGERPKAFVISQGNTTAKDILGFVNERLAKYKRIKDLVFVDSIPKNPSGKILRRVIKEKYC
ncbi:unnamed protein product [Plutella xylostella]|uniref:(diamondback moth) hypothetical protein n=1 Tax=Plutella xylostella TaxID=51655 RepID=A0A8S4DNB1_PLUXY|nr:unnamed protein product [Plutella xylostella]